MNNFHDNFLKYSYKLNETLKLIDFSLIDKFKNSILDMIEVGGTLYICGNGGSAANSIHIANDFLYGATKNIKKALKVEALSANSSIVTCLANDIGYDSIYEYQIKMKAESNDILLVLSGSGNSENIIKALSMAKEKKAKCVGILGYDGGKALDMLDIPIHTPVNDMQIAEDIQLIICHTIMQEFCKNYDR